MEIIIFEWWTSKHEDTENTQLYQDHRTEKVTKTSVQIKIKVCRLHVKKTLGLELVSEEATQMKMFYCV